MGDQTCRAISREMLKPGDHICTERWNGLYYHHGIYVGDDLVIHVNGPRKRSAYSSTKMKSSSSASSVYHATCQNNGCQKGFNCGTIKTCLDCFLDGHSLYVYDYECSIVRQYVIQYGGCIKSPEEVIEFATSKLQRKDFCAGYNLLVSNCEHFATLCKTGLAFSMQSIILTAKTVAFLTK
ncbi:lrat domain-containing protein [Citrus sinensis]|uniref:Lrat domain-containing protein n=1 Tax=Citrus sinensis TaxID=2711 RepID=A0ACB8IQ78_CITSI|nr:lrat domain-containing protein [Citrus sinensis]